MASWPLSLPQYVQLDGYSEQPVDITIRSSIDVGPEKTRPRYQSSPIDFACPLLLTSAQTDTLDDFYELTLNFGSTAFDWLHPRKLTAATFQFRARPSYDALGGGLFRTTLNLRKWP